MSKTIEITLADVLDQVKFSCLLPDLVEGWLTRQIIRETAIQEGIQVTPEELQAAADQIRLLNQLQQADETHAWLTQHHLSLDEFEALAEANVLSNKLALHLFSEQVAPHFATQRLMYEQAIASEIRLEDPDLALELFYALQEGEVTFPEVAQSYISDPDLRRTGGYRGPLTRNQLRPELSAAIFAAQPPQILKPVVTAEGVHLIYVEAILEPMLDEQTHAHILSSLFWDWLRTQINEIQPLIKL